MKNIFAVTVPLVMLALIIYFFWQQGRQFGMGTAQREDEWIVADSSYRKPEIYAACQRFKQGEKVALSDLAKAHDADGSDLSAKLLCYDEKGKPLSGFLDTDKPGIQSLSWEVASVCTGRRIRKKMIVLVDGRVRCERDRE